MASGQLVFGKDSEKTWEIHLPTEYFIKTTESGSKLYFSSNNPLNFNIGDYPYPDSGYLNDGTMYFYLDKNGKKCYLIGSKALTITWINDTEYWNWTTDPKSRFDKVAKLEKVWSLEISGHIEGDKLTKNTRYGAFLVYKIGEPSNKLEAADVAITFNKERGDQHKEGKVNLLEGTDRQDSWKEVRLGELTTDKCENHGAVNMKLEDQRPFEKNGLIVEGIELRPIQYPIYLNDGTLYFSIDKNGKKYYMIGSKALTIPWVDDTMYWDWTTDPNSRFANVAKLKTVWFLKISGNIEGDKLTKNTKYAAYLVYKIEKQYNNFEAATVAVTFNKEGGDQHNEGNVNLLEGIERLDSWKEVKLGEIHTDNSENSGAVNMNLEDQRAYEKKGLVVEGIELRAIE